MSVNLRATGPSYGQTITRRSRIAYFPQAFSVADFDEEALELPRPPASEPAACDMYLI